MTLHPASQQDGEVEAAWLEHVRILLRAAASLAATGTPTEVLVRPQRPLARELRSIARGAGVEAYISRSGRYLVARFVLSGASEGPAGPAVL